MDIKYIQKNERGSKSSSEAAVVIPTPNTIDRLYASNITIDGTDRLLLITQGSLIAHVVLSEIITWDLEDAIITIITEDPTPLQLRFVSSAERDLALIILENGINL